MFDVALRSERRPEVNHERRGATSTVPINFTLLLALWTVTVVVGSIAVGFQWRHVADQQTTLRLAQETATANANAREQQLIARETRLQALRVRQTDRIKHMLKTGEKFDASIVMLNMAEDIESEKFSDPELVQNFITMMHELIDTHKTASGGEQQLGQE